MAEGVMGKLKEKRWSSQFEKHTAWHEASILEDLDCKQNWTNLKSG